MKREEQAEAKKTFQEMMAELSSDIIINKWVDSLKQVDDRTPSVLTTHLREAIKTFVLELIDQKDGYKFMRKFLNGHIEKDPMYQNATVKAEGEDDV